jgi:DNA-directed RNA polymerase subunit H
VLPLTRIRKADKKMHILQSKHTILKQEEVEKLLETYNISIAQLPSINIKDACLPENANVGDVIKIERKSEEGGSIFYYRAVVL